MPWEERRLWRRLVFQFSSTTSFLVVGPLEIVLLPTRLTITPLAPRRENRGPYWIIFRFQHASFQGHIFKIFVDSGGKGEESALTPPSQNPADALAPVNHAAVCFSLYELINLHIDPLLDLP